MSCQSQLSLAEDAAQRSLEGLMLLADERPLPVCVPKVAWSLFPSAVLLNNYWCMHRTYVGALRIYCMETQSFMEDFLESTWATGGEGMRPGHRPCLELSGLTARLPGGSALTLRLYLHQQPRMPFVCFVFVFYDQTNTASVRVLEKWKIGWEPFDRAVSQNMWPCLGWQEGRRGSWV